MPALLRFPPACQRGITLLETLVACVVLAILAAMAVPAFEEFRLNARRTSELNAMLRSLHQARSHAILRAVPVAICKSSNGWQCTPDAENWSAGYLMFANTDRDSPPQVDRDEPVLRVAPRVERLTITANRNALTYWPVSVAGTTASIVFCDQRGSAAARAIIVSYTGRPRISQRDASGRPLQCT